MLTFVCAGCGATLAAAEPGVHPFACPNARTRDDADHVLRRAGEPTGPFPTDEDLNPFIRYRTLLAVHALSTACGSSDHDFTSLVHDLNGAVSRVDGRGFAETPFAPSPERARKLG